MKKSFTAVLVWLALMLLATFALMAQDDTRAVQTWKVQKYDLTVTLPTSDSDRAIAGRATLNLTNISGKSASSLTLRISPLAVVSAISINNAPADFRKSEEKIGSGGTLQRVAMRFPDIASGGLLVATVEYKFPVKDNSALAAVSPVGAQFLPQSFWYPTPTSWLFARGADTAPFTLKVSGPAALSFVSSGVSSSSGFEQKLSGQPFFAAGTWDVVNSSGVEVYVPKGGSPSSRARAEELALLYSEARNFVASSLGKVPPAPLRIVGVRRGAGFNGGGTLFVDEAVFRRSKIDSQTAMSLAEASAKLWIGNSVDVSGDAQGVIAEGLPRYLATEFLESKFGKDVADVERLRHRTAYAAVSRRDLPLIQVSPIDDFYFGEVANKGSMIWRLLTRKVGADAVNNAMKSAMSDGTITVRELRDAFPAEKDLLDYLFEKTTDMNLLAGLPQPAGAETKVALRNTGPIDATVTVSATLANGQKMDTSATIRAMSFGDVAFKTASKVIRVEIDREKLYPQTDYSDDVAPRETTDNDLLLAVKRNFDKQDFSAAAATAQTVLNSYPRYDDVRVLLARSLLAAGKTADAEREFRAVLDEKLPTSRSLAWANVGLGDLAARSNRNSEALKYAEAAIQADAEYGAGVAARNLRNKIGSGSAGDPEAKQFLADFSKAAASNRKAEIDALVVPGEATKFASGLSGSTEQWQATFRQADRLDANHILVEADVSLKLLASEPSSGLAVFRLSKVGNAWKLISVDVFEVK